MKDTQLVKESKKSKEELKSPTTAGFKPTTSRVLLGRHVVYRWATTAALKDDLLIYQKYFLTVNKLNECLK